MNEKDAMFGFGPNKNQLDIMLQHVTEFMEEYFDQNPLSHLGIIICKYGEAQVLSLLNGSKRAAVIAIGVIREGVTAGLVGKDAGEFSLQNGLEVVGKSLGYMPRNGSREVLIVVGALSTCDPGDVLVETLPRLIKTNIRVNCLAMCAEMHVCRKISETSGGIMGVALDGRHMKDLLFNFIAPPPALIKEQNETQMTCVFMPMGFPKRETEEVPTLVHATAAAGSGSVARDDKLIFARTSYECPRCKAKASELPTDCSVCGLKLILAPHLARSFHHLFPVPPFREIPEDLQLSDHSNKTQNNNNKEHPLPHKVTSFKLPPVVSSSTSLSPQKTTSMGFKNQDGTNEVQIDSSILFNSKDCDRCCFGCLKIIGVQPIDDQSKNGKKSKSKSSSSSSSKQIDNSVTLRFQCPDCKNVFCASCDAFLHETLHNCPGCLCL